MNELIIREVPKSGPGAKDVGTVDECSFQLVHIDKLITVRATSASDKKQWMNIVDSHIGLVDGQLSSESKNDLFLNQNMSKKMIGTLEIKLIEATKLTGTDKIRKLS